jgi:transposase
MRGDQLARQWRIIRAIETSPSGLTVSEIAKREETGIRTIYRDLEALQPASHAKAQSAPSKTSILLLPFIKIFLSRCFRKYPPFFLFSMARDIMPPKTAKFSKTKEIFAPFAPWREEIG